MKKKFPSVTLMVTLLQRSHHDYFDLNEPSKQIYFNFPLKDMLSTSTVFTLTDRFFSYFSKGEEMASSPREISSNLLHL